MELMKYFVPDCFKSFKCTARECSDNCCIGWEIQVDDESYDYYSGLNCRLGERIIKNIEVSDTKHFILGENDRCPFLNKDNLCDIILELGKERIPEICKNHPRFFTWLYDRCEMGIGLCCEEGAKRLFSNSEKLKIEASYTLTDNLSDVLTYARDVAFSILQNRDYSIFLRLKAFLEFSKKIDRCLIVEDIERIKEICREDLKFFEKAGVSSDEGKEKIIGIFKKLEPINDEWCGFVEKIQLNSKRIFKARDDFFKFYKDKLYEYEHLAVYFVFRYFLKAADDFDLLSKANFIVLNVLFTMIMDINSYLESGEVDRIKNSKLLSKEVEYSEENIALVEEMSYVEFEDLWILIDNF